MRSLSRRLPWLVALAAALAVAAPALAGPWAREKGQVFLTLSEQHDSAGESWTGLWAEYGLTPRITLGIDAGRSGQGDGKFVLWGQRAWVRGEHRFAASLGLGASLVDGEVMPMAQGGASWGRGIATRFGPGWVTIEGRALVTARNIEISQKVDARTTAIYAYMLPETSGKAEITLGLRPRDKLMIINQLQVEARKQSGIEARLASSLVYDLWQPAKVELGIVTPIQGDGEPALKLGMWLEF